MKLENLHAFAFASVVAIAASTGCTGASDPCDAAVAAATSCGMPMTATACEALPDDQKSALADGLAKLTCDQAGTDSGSNATTVPDAATCKLAGWPCPTAFGPATDGRAPKYPIVFVSGIDGNATFDWNPAILRAVTDATGASVIHAVLPSWASTDERASSLWGTLQAHGGGTKGKKFNLICYAVGGIDCRDLASPAGLFADDPSTYAAVSASIASITTMDTPHLGTRVADAAVLALQTGDASDLLAGFGLASTATGPVAGGALLGTLQGLTLTAMAKTSKRLTDGAGILYQSFAGVSHVNADASQPSADAIAAACVDAKGNPAIFGGGDSLPIDETQLPLVATTPFGGASLDGNGDTVVGPTDGMVSVASAKYGIFRGCVPTDHYHVIGQINRIGQDVRTGYDVRRFYSWLASDLAAGGF